MEHSDDDVSPAFDLEFGPGYVRLRQLTDVSGRITIPMSILRLMPEWQQRQVVPLFELELPKRGLRASKVGHDHVRDVLVIVTERETGR